MRALILAISLITAASLISACGDGPEVSDGCVNGARKENTDRKNPCGAAATPTREPEQDCFVSGWEIAADGAEIPTGITCRARVEP